MVVRKAGMMVERRAAERALHSADSKADLTEPQMAANSDELKVVL